MLLRSDNPEKYSDRAKVEHSGAVATVSFVFQAELGQQPKSKSLDVQVAEANEASRKALESGPKTAPKEEEGEKPQ
jgi:hypothetical protein